MFHTKVVQKIKTPILCSITFFSSENRAVYEIMWKNMESGRPQVTIWRMRIACWTPKATNTLIICIARSKSDGTRAETTFGLSAKRTNPFKSAGLSVQSTAGSRGVRISGQRLYRPCSDVQCKTTGYPLHSHLSPSLPLPCVTVCHQVLNAL